MSLVYRKIWSIWNGSIHCILDKDNCQEWIVSNWELIPHEKIDLDKFFERLFSKNLLLRLYLLDVFFDSIVQLWFSMMINLKKRLWLFGKIQSMIRTWRWASGSTLCFHLTELFHQWKIVLSMKTKCMTMIFLNTSFHFHSFERIVLPKQIIVSILRTVFYLSIDCNFLRSCHWQQQQSPKFVEVFEQVKSFNNYSRKEISFEYSMDEKLDAIYQDNWATKFANVWLHYRSRSYVHS